jgi:hypothetical protein
MTTNLTFKPGKNGSVSIIEICKAFESVNDSHLLLVRRERPYRIPSAYMEWRYISAIVAAALIAMDSEILAKRDLATFLHSHRMALWFIKQAPIYCLSESIIDAFDGTDIECKPETLKLLKPAIYSFILLFPKGLIKSGENSPVEFATVNVSDRNKPEEAHGSYKGIEVPYLQHEHDINIHFSCIDNDGNVFFSGMGLYPDGSVRYNEKNELGLNKSEEADRKFLKKMRSLVLQTLFVMQYEPELLQEPSASSYTISGKGFGAKQTEKEIILKPRILAFPVYKPKCISASNGGFHSSPHPHPRRGHWRKVEKNEGIKLTWVRPTFVGAKNV